MEIDNDGFCGQCAAERRQKTMTDREGPTRMVREYESCLGCKWHSMSMRKSGRNPDYDHYCHKSGAPRWYAAVFEDGAAWIGKDDRTPNWCPIKKENES